jgi:O-antigen/teichoic acid export membrane protein
MTSLAERAYRGLGWNLMGRSGQQVVGLLADVVLARMLAPEDFGTVGLALAFVHIGKLPASLGLATAVVQQREDSPLVSSSVFYFNMSMGLLLFAATLLLAGPMAGWFGDVRLGGVLRWSALIIPIYAFNIVQQALLRRRLDFRKLAVRGIAAQLAGAAAGLWAVFNGWGLMSLVAKHLVAETVGAVAFWWRASWYPQLHFAWREVRTLLSTGIYVFAAQSADVMLKRAVVLTVGGVFGTTLLGLMNRAESLNGLVTNYVANGFKDIALPSLSIVRDDRERFRSALFGMLQVIALLSFGLTGTLYFAAHDIIVLLLGGQWMKAVVIFQWLAFRAPAMASDGVISFAFVASGRSARYFRYDLMKKLLSATPIMVALVASFEVFLGAVVAASVAVWLLNHAVLAGELGLSRQQRVQCTLPYLMASAASALPVMWAAPHWADLPLGHTMQAVLFALLYGVTNVLFRTGGVRLIIHHGTGWATGLRKA